MKDYASGICYLSSCFALFISASKPGQSKDATKNVHTQLLNLLFFLTRYIWYGFNGHAVKPGRLFIYDIQGLYCINETIL